MGTFGLTFKEFVAPTLNEAYTPWGDSNKFQNKAQRIESGKKVEAQILDALRNIGWQVENATAQEDMFSKIDGWLVQNGSRIALQVKYRDNAKGNDIFLEVKKDYYKNIPGRDMTGKAQLYVTLSNDRKKIMIRKAAEAKSIALQMEEELREFLKLNPTANRKVTPSGVIMINPDPRTGVMKLKAYINPFAFTWKQDIPVSLAA